MQGPILLTQNPDSTTLGRLGAAQDKGEGSWVVAVGR